jgi:hypothetical protein
MGGQITPVCWWTGSAWWWHLPGCWAWQRQIVSAPGRVWQHACVVLLLGALAVRVWALSGNLLPWVVLQAGGLVLMLLLARCKVIAGAWGIRLGAVVAVYIVAKLLELGDHLVFDATAGLVSGHSLKHMVAALAAWPVISAMHNVPIQNLKKMRRLREF